MGHSPLSNRFKTLFIVSFDGMGDPRDHWDLLNNLIELHQGSASVPGYRLAVTFTKEAKMWLKMLHVGSITS